MKPSSNHEEDSTRPPNMIITGKNKENRNLIPNQYIHESIRFNNPKTFPHDNHIHHIGNLEEFGLSYYEAKAYLTLIGRGSLSASEIAYYSSLPRTKIYLTLKKLEKKGLSVISQQKPLICSAITPKEAFEEIISVQEQRLKNMKKVIEKLEKMNDQNNYQKGLEEKRYFILDAKSTYQRLITLIENSRISVTAILDIWGLRLISQCRESLIKALKKNIKIQFLISNQCLGHDSLLTLPHEINIKVGNIFSNIVLIDSSNIINIDGGNGKAALFTSIDVLGFSYMKTFEEEWNRAIELRPLINIDNDIQLKVIQFMKFVEEIANNSNSNLYLSYFKSASENSNELQNKNLISFSPEKNKTNKTLNFNHDSGFDDANNAFSLVMNDILEKYGIDFKNMDKEDLLKIIDRALRIFCSGGIKFDEDNGIITIYSNNQAKNKYLCIWSYLITCYFRILDYRLVTIPTINKSDLDTTDKLIIKISKST